MGSKSAAKASSSSSKPAKSSKSARAAAAGSPPAASRMLSRETIDDSDADMASSSSEAERAVPAMSSSKVKPKPRLVAEDSESESESGSESSSEEEEEQVQAGTSQTLNYVPPRNMQKVVLASGSDFDYAKLLANPKLQLYTVRLPDNVKTKSLERLSLSVNESGAGLTGSLSTKAGEYIVKAADPQGAAEELKNLRVLVPNAKSAAYVSAPRLLTGALSLAPIIPIASSSNLPPSSASAPKSRMYVPPPKPVRLQPLEKMKFRNAAFGGGAELPVPAALDEEAPAAPALVTATQDGGKDAKTEKKASKKRKEVGEAGEGEVKEKKKKKPKVK